MRMAHENERVEASMNVQSWHELRSSENKSIYSSSGVHLPGILVLCKADASYNSEYRCASPLISIFSVQLRFRSVSTLQQIGTNLFRHASMSTHKNMMCIQHCGTFTSLCRHKQIRTSCARKTQCLCNVKRSVHLPVLSPEVPKHRQIAGFPDLALACELWNLFLHGEVCSTYSLGQVGCIASVNRNPIRLICSARVAS